MPRQNVLMRMAGAQKGLITARRAAFAIGGVTVVVTVTSGILMTWIDKQDFNSVWDGMWWAVQTVTTVGYGDAVPRTTAGQALAMLVMLTAIGFISVVTAAITAAFIESARKQLETEGDDEFEDPQQTALVTELETISKRLAHLETLLEKRAG